MRLSISKIKLFKSCRRAYQLHYIEGLTPIETSDALQTGTKYHELIDDIYKGYGVDISNYSKETAMAVAYMRYIYPKFNVKSSEEWVYYNVGEHTLVGRVDGIADDGRLVEHKTTSMEITEEYEYDLQWDEQLLAYMLMTGAREIWYTVCRKPTIRPRRGESEKEFFDRMIDWYDEDTERKIKCMLISRTDEEIEEFKQELFKMAKEMNTTSNFYRNTAYCKQWGRRCEYAGVCLHYDPKQEYVGFVKEGEYGVPKT